MCALRCFSTLIQSHELIVDAYESLPEVALESAKLYRIEPEESSTMPSSTAAPQAALKPAGPLDVHSMPRILQAFHRDAAESKSKNTAKMYTRLVKELFKEDRIAIKDMVNTRYIAIAKLQPAAPLDVRCMPRILQAWQRDAAVSKSERTAKEYAGLVTKSSKRIV